MVDKYNENKDESKDESLVSKFIESLVLEQINRSYVGFTTKVDEFSIQKNIDSKDLVRVIHESYAQKAGFINYIGADRLLWFLTHPHSWNIPWETMSGPSFVVQTCMNLLPREYKGADRVLRLFMDVPCQTIYSQDHLVRSWSNNQIVFGGKFNFPNLSLKFLPDDLQEILLLGGNKDLESFGLPSHLTILYAPNTTLDMLTYFTTGLKPLPAGLKILNIRNIDIYGKVGPVKLPDGLEEIVYHSPVYTLTNQFVLPDRLKRLELGRVRKHGKFGKPIALPSGLNDLVIHNCDLSTLREDVDALPKGLKRLELKTFDEELDIDLPSGLEELVLPAFRQRLESTKLPNTLRTLTVHGRSWYRPEWMEFAYFVSRINLFLQNQVVIHI